MYINYQLKGLKLAWFSIENSGQSTALLVSHWVAKYVRLLAGIPCRISRVGNQSVSVWNFPYTHQIPHLWDTVVLISTLSWWFTLAVITTITSSCPRGSGFELDPDTGWLFWLRIFLIFFSTFSQMMKKILQSYWAYFGLYPSSGMWKTKDHNVIKTNSF
jgi:hypothetical protein